MFCVKEIIGYDGFTAAYETPNAHSGAEAKTSQSADKNTDTARLPRRSDRDGTTGKNNNCQIDMNAKGAKYALCKKSC